MPNAPTETKKVSLSAEETTSSFFDTEYLKTDLKGRSVRGGAVTMVAQGARFFLQMGSTIVLARLLTPQDFGLVAMVTAVTGFVMMFKDMGLSMATVQRNEINHDQISTLFWINVGLSLAVMLVIAVLAPAIAWFYGEPRLVWVTLALASAFIFGGFTIQHQALLRRQMRFGTLALIGIIAMVVSIVAAIIAAWYGAGYWALVIMQLAGAIAGAIGVWAACGWRPGWPVRSSGVRTMLAFGGNLTGFNFMNYFARNLDNVLIGRFWGAGQLGLYSKAYGLLLLPLQQVTRPMAAVAIPALSRLQNDPQQYRRYYLKAISLIAFVTMPGVMFMIFMSDEIIGLVLGKQWMASSKIFAVLGVAALIQPIMGTTGWLFVSTGRTDRMLRLGVVSAVCVLTAFAIGLPFGAVGVAAAYAICNVIFFVPFYWYSCITTPVNTVDMFHAVWRSALAGLAAAVAIVAFKVLLPGWGADITRLAIGFAICTVVYVACSCALARGISPISELIDLGRQLQRPKPASPCEVQN